MDGTGSEVAASNRRRVIAILGLVAFAVALGAVLAYAYGSGDRGTDDGGANQAGADAPAKALGFGLGGGGSDAAGDGQRGEGERCNPGLDRHDKLHPIWVRHRFGPHAQLDGGSSIPVRIAFGEV